MISLYFFCLVLFGTRIFPSNTTTTTPCVPSPYVIDLYSVTSTVKNRFACTRVYSEIINTGNVSQEICFSLQLPSEAFVSGLCLEVGGKKYSGVVQEKEAARQTHEENVVTGVTSGLVESRFVLQIITSVSMLLILFCLEEWISFVFVSQPDPTSGPCSQWSTSRC